MATDVNKYTTTREHLFKVLVIGEFGVGKYFIYSVNVFSVLLFMIFNRLFVYILDDIAKWVLIIDSKAKVNNNYVLNCV